MATWNGRLSRISGATWRSSRQLNRRRNECRSFDPDRLDVHKFADADLGELAAVAAVFDAAEGEAGIGFDCSVDKNISRFDLGGEALGKCDIGSPDAGAQAVARAIGECDGFVHALGAGDGGDG